MMALTTRELAPTLPVGLFTVTASGACAGRVAWIDSDNRHSRTLGLVDNERTELMKRPTSHATSLAFPSRCPVADPGQVFDRDCAPGVFGLGDKPLADDMILVRPETCLLLADLAESATGALATALVQSATALTVSLTDFIDLCPGERLTSGVNGEVHHTHVNAKYILDLDRIRSGFLDLNMQVVAAIGAFDECGAGRVLPIESLSLKVSETGSQSLPRIKQGQAERPVLFAKGEDALVVVDAS